MDLFDSSLLHLPKLPPAVMESACLSHLVTLDETDAGERQ
jgi:hypothetical protein